MPIPIPPLLWPFVSPAPRGSLTLITSVLDATSNWLILRYIQAALDGQELVDRHLPAAGNLGHEDQEDFKVIFVSILRGFDQWREMGKKIVRTILSFLQPF
jgi:elongator complex protein 6